MRGAVGVRSVPTCMATPLRVARVSKQLNREISRIFCEDKVILKTMRGISRDAVMDEIATVTDVVVSGDLQVAKVYISLYDTEGEDASSGTWQRIAKLQPYVRKIIGQRLSLKRTPEVRFIQDRDFEKMHKAWAILDRLREEEEGEEPDEEGEEDVEVEEKRERRRSRRSSIEIPESGSAFSDLF